MSKQSWSEEASSEQASSPRSSGGQLLAVLEDRSLELYDVGAPRGRFADSELILVEAQEVGSPVVEPSVFGVYAPSTGSYRSIYLVDLLEKNTVIDGSTRLILSPVVAVGYELSPELCASWASYLDPDREFAPATPEQVKLYRLSKLLSDLITEQWSLELRRGFNLSDTDPEVRAILKNMADLFEEIETSHGLSRDQAQLLKRLFAVDDGRFEATNLNLVRHHLDTVLAITE